MQSQYHLTTFGCQMNEHDSERMKGMLESLGYREAPAREDADLILFNTCSIRESADSRFIAHLGEARRLKRERPQRVVGVGGCWAQSVKEEVFERFPFVDVAFGPGQVHTSRRVPHERLAERAGLLRVRGVHRPSARPSRAPLPGLGADQRRLQLPLRLLHRPVHTRARGQPPAGRAASRRSRRWPRTGCARSRCSARTSTPTGATCPRRRRAASGRASPGCCGCSTASRGSSGSATRARTRRTCART